jgi:hypothetical protein
MHGTQSYVLLRPLPYREPGRLVLTFNSPVHNKDAKIFVPYRQFKEWANRNHSYAGMARGLPCSDDRVRQCQGCDRGLDVSNSH